jgi:hypothetical protein
MPQRGCCAVDKKKLHYVSYYFSFKCVKVTVSDTVCVCVRVCVCVCVSEFYDTNS